MPVSSAGNATKRRRATIVQSAPEFSHHKIAASKDGCSLPRKSSRFPRIWGRAKLGIVAESSRLERIVGSSCRRPSVAHAGIAFPDLETSGANRFPTMSEFDRKSISLESDINPDYCFEGVVGKSRAIREVLEQVAIVATTDATVLLHGET